MKETLDAQFTARQIGKISRLLRPTLAIVLGSGFQQAVARMEVESEIPYHKLAGFPPVGVSGHAGKLLIGHAGRHAGAGVERAGAFLRGASDGTGDVRDARAGGVWDAGRCC